MDNSTNPTWREQTVTVKPKETKEVVFFDTKPNHVYINNLSQTDLYVGLSVIPDNVKYEMHVAAGKENFSAKLFGTTRVNIYNDSNEVATFILVTFYDKFNPTTLVKPGSISIDSGGYDGEIKKFSAPLPKGSNVIGQVVIADMPPLEVTNDPVKQRHYSYDASVSTTAVTVSFEHPISKIIYLENEGDSDLYVNFDGDSLDSSNDGLNGSIRLKPGEMLTDFPRKAYKMNLIRKNGKDTVRFLGV
ncbi:hypothetical protein [Bacillus sp. FSL L8-0637]|uniref:hypothetical protein n=1 Tax=Bacillus sp. FSL L8-0637 TaxID=2954753 RepID=UPI0030FC0381